MVVLRRIFCLPHIVSVFKTAVLLWMPDPAGRDVEIIKKSLIVVKNLEAATEVICSRTPSQLQYLKQLYHSKFGVYLEHEIESNTSGDLQKVRFLCKCHLYRVLCSTRKSLNNNGNLKIKNVTFISNSDDKY